MSSKIVRITDATVHNQGPVSEPSRATWFSDQFGDMARAKKTRIPDGHVLVELECSDGHLIALVVCSTHKHVDLMLTVGGWEVSPGYQGPNTQLVEGQGAVGAGLANV